MGKAMLCRMPHLIPMATAIPSAILKSGCTECPEIIKLIMHNRKVLLYYILRRIEANVQWEEFKREREERHFARANDAKTKDCLHTNSIKRLNI